jgi:hypothetical protein
MKPSTSVPALATALRSLGLSLYPELRMTWAPPTAPGGKEHHTVYLMKHT